MEFRIADTFTDSLVKLTGDEQKAGVNHNCWGLTNAKGGHHESDEHKWYQ